MPSPRDSQGFVVLAALGLILAVASAVYSIGVEVALPSQTALLYALVFASLAVVTEELRVDVSDRCSVAVSNLLVALAIMLLGLWPALIVAIVLGGWAFWRTDGAAVAFNVANASVSTFLAWTVFIVCGGISGVPSADHLWMWVLAGAAANVAHELFNLAIMSVGVRLRHGTDVLRFWRVDAAPVLRLLVILTGLGVVAAVAYARAGIGALVLVFIVVFAAQYMFKLLVRGREQATTQTSLTEQYLEMNIGLAGAMVALLDSKDQYTAQHSAAVAMYCRDMAAVVGLSQVERNSVHFAGLLHDLGKIGVPDAVLRKGSRLTPAEWALMQQHPEKGAEVLSHLAAYHDIADIVRFHHERLDGSGYPYGISGDEIPELSRLLAVADTYHALTSARPYRAALSSFEALKELRTAAGVTLDAAYVDALATVLCDKSLGYRDGTSTNFNEEFAVGRLNLRLSGSAFADLSGLANARESARGT